MSYKLVVVCSNESYVLCTRSLFSKINTMLMLICGGKRSFKIGYKTPVADIISSKTSHFLEEQREKSKMLRVVNKETYKYEWYYTILELVCQKRLILKSRP